ncbi:FxsA family protein [Plastorhodobacter daqingensis]|uniref:FxsA family protein n=1 Tax=Plastorhodobacter daqingensis TaxID=1387281 RepID=A0ABW2UH44_9RHOB
MWLLALFIAVPLIEIALFIQIGGWLTLWPTLAIVVLTALIGTALVRQQGRQTLMDLRGALAELRDPSAPLAHGALLLLAGALLLTPGFLTDAVGLLLLVPPFRVALMRQAARHVQVTRFEMGGTRRYPARPSDIIEGDYEEAQGEESGPSPKRPTHRPSGWTRH